MARRNAEAKAAADNQPTEDAIGGESAEVFGIHNAKPMRKRGNHPKKSNRDEHKYGGGAASAREAKEISDAQARTAETFKNVPLGNPPAEKEDEDN